jgi:phosphate acetyltransferase
MAQSGEASILVQGGVPTQEFLVPIVASAGLRTDRRLSHVLYIDMPGHPRPLLISDMMVNIEPTLEAKAEIVQNAIDFAHIMGIPEPKVAILAGIDTVTPKMRATLDAAALCKMADRGQITGGVLDGPLAFDNAISPEAARIKGLTSPVAGRAQIIVVPDLEAGNMLAKNLTFLSHADAAGIVLGARVPIVLTSRADTVRSRLASCAVATLYAAARRRAAQVAA